MTTLSPDVNGLVTIGVTRGDAKDLLFTAMDDADTPAPINLSEAADGTASREAVLRFIVKSVPVDQSSPVELLRRTSYDGGVAIAPQVGATLGQATVLLDKPDTEAAEEDTPYSWGLHITRQDFLRSGASVGTVSYTNGSAVVTGAGTAFDEAREGDVLQPLGILNTTPVVILSVDSPTQLTMDFSGWVTEPGVAFEIRRGKPKLSVRGPFVVNPGMLG